MQNGNGAMRMEWKYTLGEESEEEEWELEWHDLENCGKEKKERQSSDINLDRQDLE